jgi:hypothetical protein
VLHEKDNIDENIEVIPVLTSKLKNSTPYPTGTFLTIGTEFTILFNRKLQTSIENTEVALTIWIRIRVK